MTAAARRLRLPWQRGSTAHVASVYPWSVHQPLSIRGVVVGVDVLSGGAHVWDPFEAYGEGLTTNPNVAIFGEPGQRKSTLVKTFLWRMAALYGDRRWIGIADPKGEYTELGERLGLTVVRLSPGGATRVNPLAPGPAAGHESPEATAVRRADTVRDLLAATLRRALRPAEEAILYAAVDAVVGSRAAEPTLGDVATLLADPTAEMAARVRKDPGRLADDASDLYFALGNLLGQSLRGMFDGRSTVRVDGAGPGLVVDLSGIDIGSPAMPLVLMTVTGWFQEFLSCPGPQRVQVTDELWIGAGDPHFVRHMQRCQKLGRTYGAANLQVAHKVTDAAAQAADGTAESKIAAGLLADCDTKVFLRQDAGQFEAAQQAFGLTDTERGWVGTLTKGRALWLVGGRRALVQHHLAGGERQLVDTDHRMRPAVGGPAA